MQNINTKIKLKLKKQISQLLNLENRKEIITSYQIEKNFIKYIKNEICKIYKI